MIFLDVGAHNGQTLQEVVLPGYGFETIYAFEPMPTQYEILVERFARDPRVRIFNYGLADSTGPRPVYGDNSRLEASIYSTKEDVDADVVTECAFYSASEFFRDYIPVGGTVIVKLNCEGAEVPILRDLADSGEIWKATNVMIDFDIRRVVGYETEAAAVIERLDAIGFDRYCLAEDVMGGDPLDTHQQRISRWLRGLRL